MRVAFATAGLMPQGWEDDHPVAAAVGAQWCVWNDPSVRWDQFDRVVVRSVWDYTKHREEFVAWAHSVGAERLRNVPSLIEENSVKTYLRDLGVPTVPTTFVEPGDLLPAFDGEVVVKPAVSAGARDTGRFGPNVHDEAAALVARINASGRIAMVQPYQGTVDDVGETAMVYLGGEFSHSLTKRAVLAPDEIAPLGTEWGEHAAAAVMLDPNLVVAGPSSDAQRDLGDAVVAGLTARHDATPLYLRVDVVADANGRPVVMEIEAIEPALYLDTSVGAAERFAAAIHAS